MRKLWLPMLCAALLSACVAHEKAGDEAAAMGDWRRAHRHYQDALNEKPNDPGVREKRDRARQEAAVQARRRAQGCEQTREWDCVISEADFALMLDPNDGQTLALKDRALRERSLAQVEAARKAGLGLQFEAAFQQLSAARQGSKDPQVQQRADQVQQELVALGSREAGRLASARKYPEALTIYRALASVDPSYSRAVRDVSAEYEEFQDQQYDQHLTQGDRALRSNDFRRAAEAYRMASKFRPGREAEALASYCDSILQAHAALDRRDFATAQAALRSAMNSGQDRGYAFELLERVEIRPYTVSVRSVMVMPTRLDGRAWNGPSSVIFHRLAQQVAAWLHRSQLNRAVDAARILPQENLPDMRVEFLLPTGERLSTGLRRGIYATFDGEAVVTGNAYDDRRIAFRVVRGADYNAEEIGRAEISLRELFDKREIALNSQTIVDLRVAAAPANGRSGGTYVGLSPVVDPNSVVAQPAPGYGSPPGNTAPVVGTPGGPVQNAGGAPPPPPPGHGNRPGYGAPPPGHGTPPGHGGTPPGHGGTPPGHGNRPPTYTPPPSNPPPTYTPPSNPPPTYTPPSNPPPTYTPPSNPPPAYTPPSNPPPAYTPPSNPPPANTPPPSNPPPPSNNPPPPTVGNPPPGGQGPGAPTPGPGGTPPGHDDKDKGKGKDDEKDKDKDKDKDKGPPASPGNGNQGGNGSPPGNGQGEGGGQNTGGGSPGQGGGNNNPGNPPGNSGGGNGPGNSGGGNGPGDGGGANNPGGNGGVGQDDKGGGKKDDDKGGGKKDDDDKGGGKGGGKRGGKSSGRNRG